MGVDTGHGRVKLCFVGQNNSLEAFSFVSVATPHRVSGLEQTVREYAKPTTIHRISVGASKFEVDTDPLSLPFSTVMERNESDDFAAREEYAALVFAALIKARAQRVRLLVLGLPVHLLDKFSELLIRRFTGSFQYDENSAPLVIERVVVLPQPLGSAIYLNSMSARVIDAPSTLIIDAGWGTVDWLVTRTNSFKVDLERSGGSPGAGAAIYRRVADVLSNRLRARIDGLDHIDHAIRTRSPLRAHGQSIDLTPHLNAARDVGVAAMRQVRARVRSTEDISIILTGGTSPLFREAVAEVFPGTHVQTVEDPLYGNVKGFVLGALQSSRKSR